MNAREAADIIASVTFHGGVAMWKPQINVQYLSGSIVVSVFFTVPHRETGDPIELSMSRAFHDRELSRMTPESFGRALLDFFVRFSEHEALESFRIGGKLVFDDHAAHGR